MSKKFDVVRCWNNWWCTSPKLRHFILPANTLICRKQVIDAQMWPWRIRPLQLAATWHTQKIPCWRAHCALGNPKQRQFKFSCIVLDVRGATLLSSQVFFLPCDYQLQRAYSRSCSGFLRENHWVHSGSPSGNIILSHTMHFTRHQDTLSQNCIHRFTSRKQDNFVNQSSTTNLVAAKQIKLLLHKIISNWLWMSSVYWSSWCTTSRYVYVFEPFFCFSWKFLFRGDHGKNIITIPR